jgi:6-phosphogluconolactonase
MMSSATTQATEARQPLVFISAFAAGDDGAIHAFHLDLKTGQLEPVDRTTDVEHPFFLALSPDQRFLYSIHARRFGGAEDEQVAAFEILGRSGRLKLLNRQSARGSAACYLDVDATGRTVLVANYATGSVAALPVRRGRIAGRSIVVLSARRFQRRSRSAKRPSRALLRDQSGQPFRAGRRPGARPDPQLPTGCLHGDARTQSGSPLSGPRPARGPGIWRSPRTASTST